ncbi:MAG: hypothetical protein H0W99_03135 [Acidobacteria bacterium]|nr:hypothetical protein [Acidobacteriota bacterium]
MDAHLLKLRQESYEAASEYHRVMGEWFAASRSQKPGADDVSSTLLEYRALAATYSNALEVLAAYLKTFEPTPLFTEELSRTVKFQDILRREMELIF